VLVSCFVKLGWGPRLENLKEAAARFRSEHGLNEWILGRDGQLILKAEVDLAHAAQLVLDFHQGLTLSSNIWWSVPIIRRCYSVVNFSASWFLVVTSTPWEPDDSLSRCIAVTELVLWHLGNPFHLEYSKKAGMCIWRGPELVEQPSSPPREEEHAGGEPLFSPDAAPPDFIEIEEQ
jgi:hypothetical protein